MNLLRTQGVVKHKPLLTVNRARGRGEDYLYNVGARGREVGQRTHFIVNHILLKVEILGKKPELYFFSAKAAIGLNSRSPHFISKKTDAPRKYVLYHKFVKR